MNKTNDEYVNEASAESQCNRILDIRVRLQEEGTGEQIIVERTKTATGKRVAQYRLA